MKKNSLHLDSPLITLGRKSKHLELLNQAGIKSISDLIWIFPKKCFELKKNSYLCEIEESYFLRDNFTVTKIQHYPSKQKSRFRRAFLRNITLFGHFENLQRDGKLTWFNAYPNLFKKLVSCKMFSVSGVCKVDTDLISLVNPEITDELKIDFPESLYRIYPTVNKVPGEKIELLINKIPESIWNTIPESLPQQILSKRALPNLNDSLKAMHFPNKLSIAQKEKINYRFIYEEIFREKLKFMFRKILGKKLVAPIILPQKIIESKLFSYMLTETQKEAIDQIKVDLSTGRPMTRLLQGDVGSGKTSVAIVVAKWFIDNGHQVALMAPTETLAFQHLSTFQNTLGNDRVVKSFSLKSSEKKKLEVSITNGDPKIFIGTQSLLSERLSWPSLGLLIIDEQQKFGVKHRTNLFEKYNGIHTLLMTATPIPRTMQIAVLGDLTISNLEIPNKELKKRSSRLVLPIHFDRYIEFVKNRLVQGEQVYIVVPTIGENEESELASITEIEKLYRSLFPRYNIQSIHGQLKSAEKDKVFTEFRHKKIDILVATSLIEVGIDVHNASIMSVYNPERFGMSSLHQLRGRVGRGTKPGFFFMISNKELSKQSLQRLQFLEKNDDGQKIAEYDLLNRGSGDLFGTNQSGESKFKFMTNILNHSKELEEVSSDLSNLDQDNISALKRKLDSTGFGDIIIANI